MPLEELEHLAVPLVCSQVRSAAAIVVRVARVEADARKHLQDVNVAGLGSVKKLTAQLHVCVEVVDGWVILRRGCAGARQRMAIEELAEGEAELEARTLR